jgi:tetratricopeptide (TPR) repeat protein
MGIVYLCHDLHEDRPVALKTFKPQFLPDRASRDRFLREGATWVGLGAHPHIVQAYEVLRIGDGREVYLILELVAKQQGRADASLRAWLVPGQPLPVDQALLFALQIARGMTHATDTIPGLVHRDLKPENVLVGADRLAQANVPRLRVTDFGLATVLQEAGTRALAHTDQPQAHTSPETGARLRRTQLTHGVAGTPLYMAPEQWRREGLTAATDVYALGCILYEILAAVPAAPGDSLAALERAHCQGRLRPPPRGLAPDIRDLLGRCLALDPAARYASWRNVEQSLATAFHEIARRPPPPPEPAAALDRTARVAAGWARSEIGAAYLDIGQPKKALAYFEQARRLGRSEADPGLEAASLNHLGLTHGELGDARQAIPYFEQALAIDRKVGDLSGEGMDLGSLAMAYSQLGDPRRATGYYERALAIARRTGDRSGESKTLGNLGIAYRQLGDYRRAMKCYQQALAIARQMGDRRGEAADLYNLGNAYRELGDLRRAIEYYHQALAISREIGDRRGEGNSLGGLGSAYRQQGDARRAAAYHEEALAISREMGDRRSEAADLSNLGNALADLGDRQRAIDCYRRAVAISRETGDLMTVGTGSFNIAFQYAMLEEPARALPAAREAERAFSQIGQAQYAEQARQAIAALEASLPRTGRAS